MTLVYCSIPEQFVNPLFEVFDGGDFILSSWRSIEAKLTDVQIYFEDAAQTEDAKRRLHDALCLVMKAPPELEVREVPDDDWKYAYRRHFKTEHVSEHIITRPEWEEMPKTPNGEIVITLDPGMAFGTGKHETTKACLQFIDETVTKATTFLDMGTGSGILSIAARKLGVLQVTGFDVDEEAVEAANENAAKNDISDITFFKYGLGAKVKKDLPQADLVAANILGPLLIRFAEEIAPCVKDKLIISGILTTLYPEVLAKYESLGFKEIGQKTIGEWTTGLLTR